MVESHEQYHDRYRMIMDIYQANEKLNSRADEKATALLTLSGAISSVGVLLLTTDYVVGNNAFMMSIGVLIAFSFFSMLFLIHAIRPFFRRDASRIDSHGVFFYKDILKCKSPEGYKLRLDDFEDNLNMFLDSLEISIFVIARILKRKYNNIDRAVTSIFLGLVLLVVSGVVGQLL